MRGFSFLKLVRAIQGQAERARYRPGTVRDRHGPSIFRGGGMIHPHPRRVKEAILARGAETAVLACTKIGLLMPEDEITIDAAEVLAKAIVKEDKS